MLIPRALILIFATLSAAVAAEIREFPVATLERLGRELSRRDALAARASDLVFERHPEFKKVTPQGWITELGKDSDAVWWVTGSNSQPTAAYKVIFASGKQAQIEDVLGTTLPNSIARRYRARDTALNAVLPELNAAYGARYNFEVLDDPDRRGFLVYALAAFTDDKIYTGGHMRVTVSADGSKAERIDDLSRGIIRNEADPGSKTVAIGIAQVIDTPAPVETFIYTSQLYRMPIYVATRDGATWRVVNGKMHKFSKAEMQAMEKTSISDSGRAARKSR